MDAESSERVAPRLHDTGETLAGTERSGRGIRIGTPDRVRLMVWAGLTVAFLLFLTLGSVSTYEGRRVVGRARVTQVWAAKADTLPDVGQATLLRIFFLGAIALFVVASAAGLALMLEPFIPAEAVDVKSPSDAASDEGSLEVQAHRPPGE